MVNSEAKKIDSILKRLDLILIVMLAERGIQQRDIAKILGLSTKTIVKIFNAISNILFMVPTTESFVYKLTGKELLSIFIFAGYPEFSLGIYRDNDNINNVSSDSSVQEKLHIISKKILKLWIKIL